MVGAASMQRTMIDNVTVPFFVVDAFTDTAFAGNPAGVCLLGGPAPERWMAAVAREVNLSETAFAWPDGPNRWGLRWWTPTVEVPLCGHATLATAHVLLERLTTEAEPTGSPWVSSLKTATPTAAAVTADDHGPGTGPDPTVSMTSGVSVTPEVCMTFRTASGELSARSRGEVIELDFPAFERRGLTAPEEAAVRALVGAPVTDVVGYGRMVLATMADRAAVDAVEPDLLALARLPRDGLIVTAPGDGPGPGYVMRYFAPGVGIDEDPVTGSAQCAAGPYWRDRTGESTFVVEQLSARRGRLAVTVTDDGRVGIAGRAVTVIRGSLIVEPS